MKIRWENDRYYTRDIKNRENGQMTAITPGGRKVARCYSQPPCRVQERYFYKVQWVKILCFQRKGCL